MEHLVADTTRAGAKLASSARQLGDQTADFWGVDTWLLLLLLATHLT
jgi:hypothetical protein